MDVLLPSKILDVQICYICKKYLSYGPIGIYQQGSFKLVKCGRCAILGPETRSTYNVLARNLLFPCINRYEGCSQLLHFDHVPDHENACTGGLYVCPLCSRIDDDYQPSSLLYLIDHYKVRHSQSVLTKPVMSMPVLTTFENTFIYYDNSDNIFVMIYVSLYGTQFNINASTVGNRIARLKHRIKIVVDGKQRFLSEFRLCSSFDNNADIFSIEFPENLTDHSSQTFCELEFDNSQVLNSLFAPCGFDLHETKQDEESILRKYGTPLGPKFEDVNITKKFPKIYLTDEVPLTKVKEKNGISYLQTRLVLHTYLFCDFCENYCFSELATAIYSCKSCIKRICHLCYQSFMKYQFTRCPFCGTYNCYVCYYSFNIRPLILYYCSYGCEQFFKGDELQFHESICHLNQQCGLSDSDLGRHYFGKYYFESSINSKTILRYENTMVVNHNILHDRGKIYMITDTFHCLIFYHRKNHIYRFRVAHKYLPKKFFIIARTVEGGGFKEDTNNFSVWDGIGGFFVILLKVNEDHKKKEKRDKLKKKVIKISTKIGSLVGVFLLYFYFYGSTTPNVNIFRHLLKRFLFGSKNTDHDQGEKLGQKNVIKRKRSRGLMGHLFYGIIGLVFYCMKHMGSLPI